jgi:hypothetical protein
MAAKSRIVESIPAAAALLGCEPELVKRAKRLGCPAFKPGNRIAVEELRKWIAESSEALRSTGENVSRKDLKLDEEIRKLRIANDLKEKELIKRSLVIEAHAKTAERIRKLLEQKLENEDPALVAGLDVAQARVFGKRLHDQIVTEFKDFARAWAI